MNRSFKKIKDLSINLSTCPFCGETAEWVVVPGDDYVMRCSKSHASTPIAKMTPEDAAADWNAQDIVDVTITTDTKIDKYLEYGIKNVLFSESLCIDEFPPVENGFLCGEAVIITDKIILRIDPEKSYLLYDELSGFSYDYYKKPIAPEGTEIKFLKSRWRKRNLISLEFKCADERITVAPNADNECMVVCKKANDRQTEAKRDWQYGVVGNITKTHIDEQGVQRYGSSAFRGGTKVYLCGKYWKKGNRKIGAIGINRFNKYVFSDVFPDLIENVRCQRVYRPSVPALMNNWEFAGDWWGKTAEDKKGTQRFVDYWNSEVKK